MCSTLLNAKADLAALILRLGLAAIFIVHGYIKIYVSVLLIPELSMTGQQVLGWAELICGLLLAFGLLTRLAALTTIGLQVGAVVMVSGRYALAGLEWTKGSADYMKVGPEYNLILIMMCLGVLVLGGGIASLDHLLLRRSEKATVPAPAPVPSAG